MSRIVALALGGLGILTGVFAVRCVAERDASAAPADVPMRAAEANATPVLVELFTSEGCSSCPPADAVLTRLERTQPASGARVIALAHHVDYWDGIGWPDPFSSPAATTRQRAYAPLGGGTYTPQAVVDGQSQLVGSRGSALETAVAEAAKRPHAKIDIEVAAHPDGTFDVMVKTGPLPNGAASDATLFIAITQTAARVAVPRGENAGSTLDHTSIARDVRSVAAVPTQGATAKTSVRAPASLHGKATFDVVAFIQEQKSRRVLGTAAAPLGPR